MKYIQKDITTVEYGMIGHIVNCQHIMGGGVAWSIRNKWNLVYEQYLSRPKGVTMLGKCDLVYVTSELCVANLYGQHNIGNDGARYGIPAAIEQSLTEMFELANQLNIVDIFLPQIGSNRGGLDWDSEVCPIIDRVNMLYPLLQINICLYEETNNG